MRITESQLRRVIGRLIKESDFGIDPQSYRQMSAQDKHLSTVKLVAQGLASVYGSDIAAAVSEVSSDSSYRSELQKLFPTLRTVLKGVSPKYKSDEEFWIDVGDEIMRLNVPTPPEFKTPEIESWLDSDTPLTTPMPR